MSMSTYVLAFRKFDEKWNKMMQIKLMCEQAKISYPKEITQFFQGMEKESEKCLQDELNTIDIDDKWCKKWSGDHSTGYEIKISDIPKEVEIIRFVNSW